MQLDAAGQLTEASLLAIEAALPERLRRGKAAAATRITKEVQTNGARQVKAAAKKQLASATPLLKPASSQQQTPTLSPTESSEATG